MIVDCIRERRHRHSPFTISSANSCQFLHYSSSPFLSAKLRSGGKHPLLNYYSIFVLRVLLRVSLLRDALSVVLLRVSLLRDALSVVLLRVSLLRDALSVVLLRVSLLRDALSAHA